MVAFELAERGDGGELFAEELPNGRRSLTSPSTEERDRTADRVLHVAGHGLADPDRWDDREPLLERGADGTASGAAAGAGRSRRAAGAARTTGRATACGSLPWLW